MGNSIRRSTQAPDNESATVPRSAPVQEEKGDESAPQSSSVPPTVTDQTHQYYGDFDGKGYQEILNASGYELTNAQGGSDRGSNPSFAAEVPTPSPLNVRNPDNNNNNPDSPSTVVSPDHGFDFGEQFLSAQNNNNSAAVPALSLSPPPNPPPPPPQQAQDQESFSVPPIVPSRGRDSLPSQQRCLSSLPAGIQNLKLSDDPTQEGHAKPSIPEEHVEDWPQEALLYQQTLGVNDAANGGIGRSPSSKSEIVRRRYDGSDYD